MPFCSSCGSEARSDAEFCSACGHALRESAPAAPPTANTSARLSGSSLAIQPNHHARTVILVVALVALVIGLWLGFRPFSFHKGLALGQIAKRDCSGPFLSATSGPSKMPTTPAGISDTDLVLGDVSTMSTSQLEAMIPYFDEQNKYFCHQEAGGRLALPLLLIGGSLAAGLAAVVLLKPKQVAHQSR